MSKNTNTAAPAAKKSFYATIAAYWAMIMAYVKGFKLPSLPSFDSVVHAVYPVAAIGLMLVATIGVAAGVVSTVDANQRITAAAESQAAAVTAATQNTIGSRIYSAGQTVYGYTVQPVVNADGAVRNRVFGTAPAAVAQAPVAQ